MHQEFCDPKQFLFKAHGPGLESTENTSSKNQTTPCKYKVKMNAFVTWGIRLRIDLVRQQTVEQPFGPDSSDPLGKVRTSFQHRNQMFNICFQSHPHSWMHFKWHAGIMNGMVGIGIHLRKLGTPIMGEIVMAMVGCASSSTSSLSFHFPYGICLGFVWDLFGICLVLKREISKSGREPHMSRYGDMVA